MLKFLEKSFHLTDSTIAYGPTSMIMVGKQLLLTFPDDHISKIQSMDLKTHKMTALLPKNKNHYDFLAASPDGKILYALDRESRVLSAFLLPMLFHVKDADIKELSVDAMRVSLQGDVWLCEEHTFVVYNAHLEFQCSKPRNEAGEDIFDFTDHELWEKYSWSPIFARLNPRSWMITGNVSLSGLFFQRSISLLFRVGQFMVAVTHRGDFVVMEFSRRIVMVHHEPEGPRRRFITRGCERNAQSFLLFDANSQRILQIDLVHHTIFCVLMALHVRAGARSPLFALRRSSPLFDVQVLRFPFRLAGILFEKSKKRKRS